MERRLLRGIINPAMIAVWILGLTAGLADRRLSGHLAADQIRAGDRHERAARLVRALLARLRRATATPARRASTASSTRCRLLLMVVIVILVDGQAVLKQFSEPALTDVCKRPQITV